MHASFYQFIFHSFSVYSFCFNGDITILERYSSFGEAFRLTLLFVVLVVLKPRWTHFSKLSTCATFSKLLFIILVCRVWIRIASRSLIFFNRFSSSFSFYMIDCLTLRSLRFSLIYFFVISSSLSLRSSYLSISSWFWFFMNSSTCF